MKATVTFDDTWFYINIYIDCNELSFKCTCYYEYKDCVDILLTERQQGLLNSYDHHEFMVSSKRVDRMKDYLENHSIWRKKD